MTTPPPTKPAPTAPASTRPKRGKVVPFPSRGAPPPVPTKPAATRPLCSVPGFLAAVRQARVARPDLPREAIVAAARYPSRITYVVAETIVEAVQIITSARAAKAAGCRP